MITNPYTRLEYNLYLRNLLVMELMWPYGGKLVGSAQSGHTASQYPLLFSGTRRAGSLLSGLEQLYRKTVGMPTNPGLISTTIIDYYVDFAKDYNRSFHIPHQRK